MCNQKLMSKMEIELTTDEGLVLFELLSRYSEKDKLEVAHKAEQQVLWGLQASLEKSLTEPFSENYESQLAAARKRLSSE